MKQLHRLTCFLAFFLFFTGTMPAVSAYTVSSVDISPAGYQAPGTPMTVSFVIDFPKEGAETFPKASEMQMSTGLADASWAPSMILDGMKTAMDEKAGGSLTINGWYLSYPSYQDLQVRVTLRGKIPENLSSGQQLLKVEEVDAGDSVRSTASVAMPQAPLVPLYTSSPMTTPIKKPATKKPTTKPVFSPLPTTTPTQESPLGTDAAIIAPAGAALLVMRRK